MELNKKQHRRILLLTDEMAQGGAERQLAALAVTLSNAGHDVRLVKFYDGANFYAPDMEPYGLAAESLPEGKSPMKRPLAILKIVKDWKPDLVVTYKDGTSMSACIARLFKKFNLAVSERNTTQYLSKKERLKFFLYRFADHIVPNSFSQKKFIDKHFPGLSHKVTVITNVIDSEKFHPADIHDKRDVQVVLTTARVTPQKNILNYLEAISILKNRGINAIFKWYGRSDMEEYAVQVNNKVEQLGLQDIVEFHENATNVQDIYRNSDIFCLPSIYEGFPNVLCEAMSSGLVCVASNVCDNPTILDNPERFCNPNSPESIADTLEKVLMLPTDERLNEGMRNRKRIMELCSSQSFLKKYESLFL